MIQDQSKFKDPVVPRLQPLIKVLIFLYSHTYVPHYSHFLLYL